MAGLGAASYKLALDAGDVKAGAEDARKAFRTVQSSFSSMESPLEKLQRRLEANEKAQQSFVQGSETFNRAASNIAKLRAEIEKLNATPIDSSKMKADMANVGKEVAGRIPVIGRYTSMLGNIHPAAIGAAAGIAAVGAALLAAKKAGEFVFEGVADQFAAVDAASKAARQTGFDFTTFGAIGRAGALADIENIGKPLQKFTEMVGLASLGNEKAAKTFKMLGVDAAELSKLDATDRLKFVADKLAGVENQAQRTAIAVKLFGEDGAKMAELLGGGSAAIDAMVADLERFRLGATDAQALGVEAANDAIKDVQLSVQGIFRQVAVEIAPAVKVAADELSKLLQGDYGDQAIILLKDAFWSLGYGISYAISTGDKFVAIILEMEAKILSISALYKKLTGDASGAAADWGLAAETLRQSQEKQASSGGQIFADFAKKYTDAQKEMERQAAEQKKNGPAGAINVKEEEEQRKKEQADEKAAERANKSAADKIAAMDVEKEMWGKTAKEIAREREAREMERAGVNQYLIDLFREKSAEMEALEAKKKATEEADKQAKDDARKQAAEEKRAADEQKRNKEQMHKAARQAVNAVDPNAQYKEDVKKFEEWLKAKAITIDEFAKLKEGAAKKLAKPIKIGHADTGVSGIQKGSAEAVELAWRLRSQREKAEDQRKKEEEAEWRRAWEAKHANQAKGIDEKAEVGRRAAEQAAIERQYAAGFADLIQRDAEGRGFRGEQPTDAIGGVLRNTITQQTAQQSSEAKDGPKTVGTLTEIRDILKAGNTEPISVQEVTSI